MIGYDATNAVSQGIAIREKIFSYVLSYFVFIYRDIPRLVVNITATQGTIQEASKIIFSSFEEFVCKSEKGQEDTQTNKKPMAKYYLASIFYYEPNFDFENSSLEEVKSLGEIYLKQLIQENIEFFIANVKKQLNKSNIVNNLPNFENDWEYFYWAMVKTFFSGQFSNIIQTPVSIPSRQRISDTESYKNWGVGAYLAENVLSQTSLKYNPSTGTGYVGFDFPKPNAKKEDLDSYIKYFYPPNNNTKYSPASANFHYRLQGNSSLEVINDYRDLNSKPFLKDTPSTGKWEDSPNVIKYAISSDISGNLKYIDFSLDNKVLLTNSVKLKSSIYKTIQENQLTSENDLFPSFYKLKDVTYKKKPGAKAGTGVSKVDERWKYPPRFIDVADQKTAEDNIGLSVFFEFSFIPNLQKIKNMFPDLKMNESNFNYLKDNHYLTLSKVEAIDFMQHLTKPIVISTAGTEIKLTAVQKSTKELTEVEFSQLFDVNVSLLYRITKKYLKNAEETSDHYFISYGTNLGYRAFAIGKTNNEYDLAIYYLYNPGTIPTENFPYTRATTAGLNIGNAYDDYGINIRTFNPNNIFFNDDKAQKFLNIIKNSTDPYAVVMRQEFQNNLNYNPFDTISLIREILALKVSQVPDIFATYNKEILTRAYSETSKILIDNLINNIDKI